VADRYTVGENPDHPYYRWLVIDGDDGSYARVGVSSEYVHQIAASFNNGNGWWTPAEYPWYLNGTGVRPAAYEDDDYDELVDDGEWEVDWEDDD